MKTPSPKRRTPERPAICAALAAALFSAAGVGGTNAGDRISDVAGRYAILREDKDTACMLTLQPGGKAQLAPACRDNGIVVFDPIAWRMDKGKLILKARKGHNLEMLRDATGVWRRDGAEGKGLGFRAM